MSSALAFCGVVVNGLDYQTGLEIRAVDLYAENSGEGYFVRPRFAILSCICAHPYLGGVSAPFLFPGPTLEREFSLWKTSNS